MAGRNGKHALIEIKAIDQNYPLYGRIQLAGAVDLGSALSSEHGRHGVAADPLLADRLGLKLKDELQIGETQLELRAYVEREPDRIGDGFALGPRVLMSEAALSDTGLLKPGSIVSWRYRLRLFNPGAHAEIAQRINRDFPETGWRVRTRQDAAPGLARYFDRVSLFLTLIGVSSLLVGGVGIANSVATFIGRRRRQIALLRVLGASARTVFAVYLCEVMILAAVAIVLAAALGYLLPLAISVVFGHLLPVPIRHGLYLKPLAVAAVLAVLTTLLFSLWPLAHAKEIAPIEIIRQPRTVAFARPRPGDLLLLLLIAAALIVTGFIAFDDPRLVLWYVLGVATSFPLLLGLGLSLVALARRIPKPANAALRFALSNLYRPGASTLSVTLSLGLGLTLLLTLTLIDRSLTRELRSALPVNAPSFYFINVPGKDKQRFLSALDEEQGISAVVTAPMLRGRITMVNSTPASAVSAAPGGAWALRGDRGLTYSDAVPPGSTIVAGAWWAKDYAGPPLVSFTADVAEAIGLRLGDTVTVNVFGRELTATVASLRHVDWRSLAMNFVMVFSPNALRAAPHANLVTISLPPEREALLLNRIAAAFPTVTAISVKDALAVAGAVLEKLLLGIRSMSALTILSGLLVLAGALFTSLSARTYDAVVLKIYGATRAQLLFVFSVEFLMLGLATGLFAILAGSLAAWAVTRFLLEIPFDFSVSATIPGVALSMLVTLAAGLAGVWKALGKAPAALLRED
jgi:putative ABC transport system permease protein